MKALHLASDDKIASEVDRYIIWPGRATAYMTGALEIERLRAGLERRLGDRFDPRTFHDMVLGDWPVPLGMLQTKMDRIKLVLPRVEEGVSFEAGAPSPCSFRDDRQCFDRR